MSATGRGAVRHPDDFYETPAWAVHRYLDKRALALPEFDRWLEPSAGKGAIINAVGTWCDRQCVDSPKWIAIELTPNDPLTVACRSVMFYDFLNPDVTVKNKFDFCIGNPPYKLAREFIEKALTLSHEVAFLLRLNFLEGGKRAAFFRQYPCDVHVLPNRPSFLASGKTDATAYAWFEFGRGHGGKFSVLATTPKAERLAGRVQAA